MTLVTKSGLADHMGVSKPYVSKLNKDGKLVLVVDENGIELVDLEATLSRIAKRSEVPGRSAPAVQAQPELDDKRRQDFYKAENLRLDLEERTAKLFDAVATTDAIKSAAASFVVELDRIVPRLVAQLPGLTGDPEGIEILLNDEFDALKRNLSTAFMRAPRLVEKWAKRNE